MGIEPTSEAWEASILPLYDARSSSYGFIIHNAISPGTARLYSDDYFCTLSKSQDRLTSSRLSATFPSDVLYLLP